MSNTATLLNRDRQFASGFAAADLPIQVYSVHSRSNSVWTCRRWQLPTTS